MTPILIAALLSFLFWPYRHRSWNQGHSTDKWRGWTKNPTPRFSCQTENQLALVFEHAEVAKALNTKDLRVCSQSSSLRWLSNEAWWHILVLFGPHVPTTRMLLSRPNRVGPKRNADWAHFGGNFRNILKIPSKGEYHPFLWNVFFDFSKIRSAVCPCASRELCEVLDSSQLRPRAKNYWV